MVAQALILFLSGQPDPAAPGNVEQVADFGPTAFILLVVVAIVCLIVGFAAKDKEPEDLKDHSRDYVDPRGGR